MTTGTGLQTLNGNTVISGSNTFTTGSGAVNINGAVLVADSTTVTVGSAGSGGTTTLYGNVVIGDSTGAASCTVNGAITQADSRNRALNRAEGMKSSGEATYNHLKCMCFDGFWALEADVGATPSAFTTGTGAVNLNGDVTVASGKNLHMTAPRIRAMGSKNRPTSYGFTSRSAPKSTPKHLPVSWLSAGVRPLFLSSLGSCSESGGAGSFQTGTGTSTFNGNVQISGANEFTTGTGTVRLEGATQVANTKTFSVGSAGPGNAAKTMLCPGVKRTARRSGDEANFV